MPAPGSEVPAPPRKKIDFLDRRGEHLHAVQPAARNTSKLDLRHRGPGRENERAVRRRRWGGPDLAGGGKPEKIQRRRI